MPRRTFRARRRRLRYTTTGAAALAVIAFMYALSGSGSAPAPPRGDGAQAGIGTRQASQSSDALRAAVGEPVEVDGMTFVVQQLAAVRSMPGSNGQPLIAEAGNRLWLLTVSVRNDSQAVEADPSAVESAEGSGWERISGLGTGGFTTGGSRAS